MPQVLTVGVRDAAAMLGVSHWSIRRWIRLGLLPSVKLGRRTVVELSAVQNFIATNRVGKDETIHDLSQFRA
jgi:excisionase family DNA binding protein